MTTPRILYLDAYDSFSNNIISLLEDQLQASVSSIKIDDSRFVLNDDAFLNFVDGFDGVVAGPGPGNPGKAQDIGLIAKLWTLPKEHEIPVLGICLGFQSLCLAFGASVERLREPRHGLVTPVTHCGRDLFAGTGEILATQYHSLYVHLGYDQAVRSQLWTPKKACEDLVPLAWDLSDAGNGPILMAAQHDQKPFWGVQYHPESICTNAEGKKLIRQWWRAVCTWKQLDVSQSIERFAATEIWDRVDSGRTSEDVQTKKVQWRSISLPEGAEVVALVNALREDCGGSTPLLLESGTRDGVLVNAETGRFSIVGVHDASSMDVRYFTGRNRLQVSKGQETILDCGASISDVFDHLEQTTAEHNAIAGPEGVPFWGGMVGFASYEAGLETIDVEPAEVNEKHPDVWFILVDKSVVIDHVAGTLYVQSLADGGWVDSTASRLKKLPSIGALPIPPSTSAHIVREPAQEEYCSKVRACQDQLRAGESYELCLTDTTHVRIDEDAWSLYRKLRQLNPAPFSAYLSLSSRDSSVADLNIASSSPERFLSWSRDGHCQFRPIKGTVKKAPGVTRQQAEEILRSPKEQAENLMIVDLIRHDLSGAKGVTHVSVPKLMSIEEYATVYQLVSVITGNASNPISVLAASLPPGSMTGAPKKRSCELLRSIEGAGVDGGGHARGIYSGVIGYFDVGGGGNFSVAIRTAFKWGDEECWRIGAGGAVTVLSEAEAEWEEMVTKRESALRAFGLAGG